MRGEYILTFSDGEIITVPNTIVAEGAEQFLAELFNGTAAATLHIGLCNQVPDNGDVLSDITTEPTIGTGSYARQPLSRNSTDFPTISTVNNESFVATKLLPFAASGVDFDVAFSRLFMCDVLTGFTGTLFSYSAALATPVIVAAGSTFSAQYRLYLS